MTKQKRKLIATFTGKEAEAFENDRVELTGKSHKGCYEVYMTIEKQEMCDTWLKEIGEAAEGDDKK